MCRGLHTQGCARRRRRMAAYAGDADAGGQLIDTQYMEDKERSEEVKESSGDSKRRRLDNNNDDDDEVWWQRGSHEET